MGTTSTFLRDANYGAAAETDPPFPRAHMSVVARDRVAIALSRTPLVAALLAGMPLVSLILILATSYIY